MRFSAKRLLIALLAVAILGVLLYRSRDSITLADFDWSRLKASLAQANLLLLALSVMTIYAAYFVRALRWTRLSRYLERASFGNIFPATLIGFSAIFLLGRAGEPVRPILVARKDRIPVSSSFGIYVLERVLDMMCTGIIASLALIAAPRLLEESEHNPLLVVARRGGMFLLFALLGGIAFIVYFRLRGIGVTQKKIDQWKSAGRLHGWRGRVAGLAIGFGEGLQAIRSWRDLLAAFSYSAAHWVMIALIYFWVAQSFGGRLAQLTFMDAMMVLAFTMVGSAVQLPAVGGGSQAASFLAYTVVYGVEKEPAAAAAIVIWLVTFAAVTLLGVPLLIKEGWSLGELRHLAREESAAEKHGDHVPDSFETPGDPRT
jgi:hypothetical protein